MDFLNNELSKKTIIFGLKLYVIIGIGLGALVVLVLFFLSLWLTSRKKSSRKHKHNAGVSRLPRDSKTGLGRAAFPHHVPNGNNAFPMSDPIQYRTEPMKDNVIRAPPKEQKVERAERVGSIEKGSVVPRPVDARIEATNRVHLPPVEKRIMEGERRGHGSHDKGSSASGDSRSVDSPSSAPPATGITVPEVSHLGWGHWYTLRELEAATNSFSDASVLGEGGYGIVYWGQLPDGTRIAVKNLLNNRGQAEREFKIEVEAIGRVRHKNLVRLIGYCMEGSQRMLVYEYIDNGNLEQWLHGPLGDTPPLSWDIRMKIILGTAKGLAYLHEGLEPKVVHRDVKSSNILVDSNWNPKVADFGLAKLLGTGNSHVTTRVMGTFGYVAPEYALTGMLTEKSDVYSYGVLLMEIVTGRIPVDFNRPAGEVNLVDWLKAMVSNHHSEDVVDPRIEVKPSLRVLKRTLLVALKCVDSDAHKRPKMGHVVHMLEADDNPFREERRNARESHRQKQIQTAQQNTESSTDGPYMASQVDSLKTVKGERKWKGSSDDNDQDVESSGSGHPRARRMRYEG
ncbi:hypothetical protein KP509_19G016500 [Ceratopteris richardii]|uniref:non-specific serine/threonine protein kinase n=1 Tax=Ceratopteris richardii TaxID=49495 RepID=A0A8T2SLS5_CERRI|nr:hypothetical protein KP509_19G016500 [Ceratopteris richardii]KAH7351834.1 hypothetical protein KP509_19G016500 [Ceratopteris richardii]